MTHHTKESLGLDSLLIAAPLGEVNCSGNAVIKVRKSDTA